MTVLPAEVAAHFGVNDAGFLGESTNAHWLVARGDDEFVLRRFRSARSTESARWEAAVTNALAGQGHLVPRVVADIAEVAGHTWMLMTRAAGEPGSYADDNPRRRGRQLAALHTGMVQLTGVGQRDGRMLADAIVGSPRLDGALSYFATLYPEDGRVLQWHAARTRQRFAEHDLTALPQSVIHGDFAPWNLLFTDGALTGIVDFDLAHLAYRVSDFALSWRGKYDDVVRGFDEVLPLSDAEWALLSPVRWAWLFFFVEDAIDDIRAGRTSPHPFDWVVQQLLRRSPLMGPDAKPYRAPAV